MCSWKNNDEIRNELEYLTMMGITDEMKRSHINRKFDKTWCTKTIRRMLAYFDIKRHDDVPYDEVCENRIGILWGYK